MKVRRPHAPKGGPLFFMGETFPDRNALGRVYPAFTGDDSIRAIQHGCKTVMEVEVFCFRRRNKGYQKSLAAARSSGFSQPTRPRPKTKQVRRRKTAA